MFTLFNDAIQQKKMQDQMEANAAMQQNLEARRVNPTMYEQPGNIVDFSNPASYMRGNAYNPYGYDNPFNNPNIQCQMGIVPAVHDAPPPVPTYPQNTRTWYGNQIIQVECIIILIPLILWNLMKKIMLKEEL